MLNKNLSIILAAGRGSRMKGYYGNKTTISLISGYKYPMILEILKNTPFGYKLIVVHYKKEDVMNVTKGFGVIYCEQPELNGTGGAILAARDILLEIDTEAVIITMGDVPLVTRNTYYSLLEGLKYNDMMVLGFIPKHKRQYGVLELQQDKVKRIIEWKTWKDFSLEEQEKYQICNSGIYAIRKRILLQYIPLLSSKPHIVIKNRNGVPTKIKEYFLTDLVEYMNNDGLSVRYELASERELIGVDDPDSLAIARQVFISKRR